MDFEVIREATIADIPALVAMGQRFLTESDYSRVLRNNPAQMRVLCEQLLANPDGVIFVHEDASGALTGMIGMLIFAHHLSAERVAGEMFWWVNPESRGSGRSLLRRVEQWATEHDAVKLQMISPSDQSGAFYARFGYAPIEIAYQKAVLPRKPVVIDGVIPDPFAYRDAMLAHTFTSVTVGESVFHGMAACQDPYLPEWLATRGVIPTANLLRQSPASQVEPTFLHTDQDMGDWTAILYLTPDPPPLDGTTFWRHRATGAVTSPTDADALQDPTLWEPWEHVPAALNRLVVFPAPYVHSRAIPENYGTGDGARLIQIVFGTGVPVWV